jgi:ribosomal protein S28E/S33
MGIASLLAVAFAVVSGPMGQPVARQQLDQIADRIAREDGLLEREGFTVAVSGADYEVGVVEVELMTRRDDAAEFFRERYGPVRVEVIARETHSIVRTPATGFRTEGRTLIVHYDTGGGAQFVRVDVTEQDDRVEVTVIERRWNGPVTADLLRTAHEVELSRPLDDRAVIDGATGRRLALWRPER